MANDIATGQPVPRYTIDLSLKPRDRYIVLATAYKTQIRNLTVLFDELLAELGIPTALHSTINNAARLMLRRLHSSTETEEIRGISKSVGVPLYFLVALNVVLDLLMGCTSGAVRTMTGEDGEAKMLHFRTLDWGMDPLRSVVVQLDFIKSKAASGQKILASSVTYVGFVGVLTGVRQDLSMSLNFRAVHNATTKKERLRFRLHHLLVLLGLREPVSSSLRCLLLPDEEASHSPRSLTRIAEELPPKHSTAVYLIFSDGTSTITIEKDYDAGIVRQSESFIVLTNHDLDDEISGADNSPNSRAVAKHAVRLAALEGFLDESTDRRDCIVQKWNSKLRREWRRQMKEAGIRPAELGMSTRSRKRPVKVEETRQIATVDRQAIEDSLAIRQDEVISWVSAWPTTNECTHYAAILDPRAGEVAWARRYPEKVQEPNDQTRRADFGSASSGQMP